MAFVNLSLLFGFTLLAIPIVLHLVMRQQPKQLTFPAIRFLQQRRETNRRQLQLRHWLLLLLRCLAIGMVAAALARPSVHSAQLGNWIVASALGVLLLIAGLASTLALLQQRGRLVSGLLLLATLLLAGSTAWVVRATLADDRPLLIGDDQAPVAAVLVFDTSPRMQYLWQNLTRLDEARDMADWLIRQLPPDSEVAVLDSRPFTAGFAVDLSAALRSIERLEMTGVPLPLTTVVNQAVELAASSSLVRREVYVFSDLTQPAWTDESPVALQRRLAEHNEVLLYVLDVGRDAPQNTAIGSLQLSEEVLPQSGQLTIQGDLLATGQGGTHTVELYLEQTDPTLPLIRDGQTVLPEAQLRDTQVVTLEADGRQAFQFQLHGLDVGTHQGWIELAGQDALEWDNVRYFTVKVQQALPVLVLAPPDVNTRFFTEAVAPFAFRQTGRATYECTVLQQAQLPNLVLDDYAAVCLIDPQPLTPPDWEQLAGYVRRGGGLGIFLGHNAEPAAFNVAAANDVLGGQLVRQWRSAGDLFLAPRDLNHPITAAFRDIATSVPWQQFPVHRHWVLGDLVDHARIVIPFSNNLPAVIETSLDRGRSLTMTTPISDSLRLRGRQPWNELPTGTDAWPYFVLINEMLRYLVDTAGIKLNYLAGDTAVLPNNPERHPDRYQLFTPLGQPQEALATEGRVTVRWTESPGAYRLRGYREGPVVRGFSVNLPESASQLRRIDREGLDELLGAERYHFARDRDEIVLGIGQARRGFEFYPWLVCLAALVLAMEQLFSNRFYSQVSRG